MTLPLGMTEAMLQDMKSDLGEDDVMWDFHDQDWQCEIGRVLGTQDAEELAAFLTILQREINRRMARKRELNICEYCAMFKAFNTDKYLHPDKYTFVSFGGRMRINRQILMDACA